ncbi:hypothetical protein O77CONTIG1_00622 [Leptolyngbya sp. O-77]|nr:hypothetical protein O77CONTIG1_00622 [Leptolyngbya sp. O-77]
MTLAYASELTLEQYPWFAALLSLAHATGRPRSVNLMLVVQAILYVLMNCIKPSAFVSLYRSTGTELSTTSITRGRASARLVPVRWNQPSNKLTVAYRFRGHGGNQSMCRTS